jgi:ribosomal protein L6P/L9E
MKLIINFSEFDQVSLGTINGKRVLTLSKNNSASYIQVPTCLDYTLFNNSIEIFCNSNLQKDISIFNIFNKTITDVKNGSLSLAKKKILLKGLGFRSTFDSPLSTLTFKLGYSHLNTLNVPDYITNVKIKKNTILLESTDKILLGDYMRKIHQLKESDIYKGKGFSYKYDTKKLKIIKKK